MHILLYGLQVFDVCIKHYIVHINMLLCVRVAERYGHLPWTRVNENSTIIKQKSVRNCKTHADDSHLLSYCNCVRLYMRGAYGN